MKYFIDKDYTETDTAVIYSEEYLKRHIEDFGKCDELMEVSFGEKYVINISLQKKNDSTRKKGTVS